MEKLAMLLAHRRIPGEHPGRSRIDASFHDDNFSHKEPTIEEVSRILVTSVTKSQP